MSINVNKNEYPIHMDNQNNLSNDNTQEEKHIETKEKADSSLKNQNKEKTHGKAKEVKSKKTNTDIPLEILDQLAKIYKSNIDK